MFQLQLASTDVTNGNLAVAWCVDQQLLQQLATLEIKDPQVVIVVAPQDHYHPSKEYRKVVPLKDLMTYLELRVAGPNNIWAFVSKLTDVGEVRSCYLRRSNGEFRTTVLSYGGNAFDVDQWDYSEEPDRELFFAKPVSINVPAGVFAKEPAKWEKTWVNLWFRGKPQDQCDFRRRRLLAYTVQPVVMLFDLVIRLFAMVIPFLWLSRGLTFKYLIHPLTYGLSDLGELFKGGSWTIPHLPEDTAYDPELTLSYVFRKLWKTPVMPVSLFAIWLLVRFHIIAQALLVVAFILVIACLALFFASGLIGRASHAFAEWVNKLSWFNKADESLWYLDKNEIEALACTSDVAKRKSISALPRSHRTIRLRFQDLKAKVCRPFSA